MKSASRKVAPVSGAEVGRNYGEKAKRAIIIQQIVSITADCDGDALVVEVIKNGPACHTGADSCFFAPVYITPELHPFSYDGLYEMIEGRKNEPQEGSYTTYLFQKGMDKILKKIGEECTEVIIAGAKNDREEAVYEIADLA